MPAASDQAVTAVSVPRCATKRLITLHCPMCGVRLELEVVVSDGFDGEAWLDTLTLRQWEELHDLHEIAGRTRTRRITP